MNRLLKEYADANFVALAIAFVILARPFLFNGAKRYSIVRHELESVAVMFGLALAVGHAGVLPSATGMLSAAMWLAFGFGYAVLAVRKEDRRERRLGILFGSVFALIIAAMCIPNWRTAQRLIFG